MFRIRAFVIAVIGGLTVAAAAVAEWPLFRGDPRQTGVAKAALPEQLAVRWEVKFKEGIESTPAIVGQVLYVGTFDEHLYALDLATGKVKWKTKLGPIKAPVSVRDGSVYVGDIDGKFHCVDAATGKVRWAFESGAEITAGANFTGESVLFGSGDESLYCLTKEGKLRWKFRVPGGPVMGTPAVVGERTFVSGCDSKLHVLDVTNGKELAALDLEGQTGASAAVIGDSLYVGTMSNQFLAINWQKPEIAWKFEAERRQQPFFASAAVTDALVVVGSRDKRIYALKRKTGKEAWSFLTDGKVDSSPVIASGRVYAGSLDGNLYVLNLAKGTELQRIKLDSPILGSPAVGGNSLVIGTDKGTLYCLGAKQ